MISFNFYTKKEPDTLITKALQNSTSAKFGKKGRKNLCDHVLLFIFDLLGQLISKGLFGVFDYPKKRTKNVCPSRLGQKFEFSSSFFGRIENTKKAFRN